MVFNGGDQEMEGAETYILEASVAVKWFILEEYSREAALLRETYVEGVIDLVAPSLLPYEVLNALKHSAAFGEEELKEIAKTLEDLQITYYHLEGELALKAVETAMRKGITIYDAAYVALAQHLGAKLYTADERLLRKMGESPIIEHIMKFKPP